MSTKKTIYKTLLPVLLFSLLFAGCGGSATEAEIPPEEREEIQETPAAEEKTIVLDYSNEVKVDQLVQGDVDQLLENSADYLYPEDRFFKPRMMNEEGMLFGEESEEYNSTRCGLLELDLNTGEYRELVRAEHEDGFTAMTIQYCNNDYLLYDEAYCTEYQETGYSNKVISLDLHTLEKKVLFEEAPGLSFNTLSADEDDQDGFMFSIYSMKDDKYKLYYVSKDSFEPDLIAENARSPVYINGEWYCVVNNNGMAQIFQDGTIKEIPVEGLAGEIYEMSGIDETHILLIDAKNTGGWLKSRASIIDVTDMSAEYLFTQSTLMEMSSGGSQFIKWSGDQLEEGYGIRSNLYDYKNDLYYHVITNYIWLSEKGFAYRKYLIPPKDAVKGTAMNRDVTCISYVPFNQD